MKAGKAAALLVVKLDRLTRSVRNLGTPVETYFLAGKWSLMSVCEQIDTRTAAGRMLLNILAAVSQWDRGAIGERTAEALAYKRRQRQYTGGEPPYGWQLAADGVHLEPHLEEQTIIREALALKAAGNPSVHTVETLMTEPLEKPTQLRLPREALERAETLIPLLAKHPEFRALGRLSKATVLRLAVLHGLEVLEQRVRGKANPQAPRR